MVGGHHKNCIKERLRTTVVEGEEGFAEAGFLHIVLFVLVFLKERKYNPTVSHGRREERSGVSTGRFWRPTVPLIKQCN